MLTRLPRNRSPRPKRSQSALLAYIATWLVTGAVVAWLAILALGAFEDDSVTLPPVRETELSDAARRAECQLRRGRIAEFAAPPVDARPGTRAAIPGVYESPPAREMLGAAVRRGIIVIHHRTELPSELVDQLRTLQEAVPRGTIVTTEAARMPYEVAVTGYRRLLGCPRLTEQTIDAIRLFRGRFLGSGPDSPG